MTIRFGVPSPTKNVDVKGSTRWTTLDSSGNVTWSSTAGDVVSLAPDGTSCVITGNKPGVAKITARDDTGSEVTDAILVGGLLAYGPDGTLYGTYAKDWVPVWSASDIPTADFMNDNNYAFSFVPPTTADTSFNVTCYLISVQTMTRLVPPDTARTMGSASDTPVEITELGGVDNIPNGTGLMGLYTNLEQSDLTMVRRLDATVNFSGSASWTPEGISTTNYSVRWTGYVRTDEEGDYFFQIVSSGGARLWVDGKLMINNPASHTTATDDSDYIALRASQRVLITMEYYYNNETSGAIAQLQWKTPGAASASAIPTANLYPSVE